MTEMYTIYLVIYPIALYRSMINNESTNNLEVNQHASVNSHPKLSQHR